jgi:cytoskeletal protein CcmA (bactofilin family)
VSDASSLFRRRRPRGEGETPPAPPTDKSFPNPYRDDALRGISDPRAVKPMTQAPARRVTDLQAPAPAVAPLPPITSPAANPDEARLTVGRNIRLKGEISACDVLVVEGEVEASITCRLLEVTKTGVFRGHAEVEIAEIHGHVDGDLTAKKLLKVLAGGRVEGRIRYATIEVASGGQLGGDIGTLAADAQHATVAGLPGAAELAAAVNRGPAR